MVDSFLREVLIPVLDQLIRQEISLVDAKDELLVFPSLFDVLVQISRVEEVRVPCIHNLQEHVRPLYDPPELLPHLDVLLKRSDGQGYVVLLDFGQVSPPLKESIGLVLLDLFLGELFAPLRPSRDLKRLVVRIGLAIFHELVNHRDTICGHYCASKLNFPLLLSHELLLRHLG